MPQVLGHLGATTDSYLSIIKGLWRICRPGALLRIVVPHPRHDHYPNDLTHVLPDEPWRGRLQRGKIQPAALQEAIRMHANVIMWITIVMRAVKAGA